MLLTLVSVGWARSDLRVLDASGAEVAFLDFSAWRTAATLTLGDTVYSIRKDPYDGALIVAGPNDVPVAQAVKPSMWKRDYDLEWTGGDETGGGRGRLTRASSWRSTFTVVQDDGRLFVEVARRGTWRSRLEITADDAAPLPVVLFIATLVAFILRAEQAAASAGG